MLVCLLLALATLAVYLPVRNFGFVNYDDFVYFSSNSHVLSGLAWANVQWAFTSGETGNWIPLTWLSLMLDAQLFGTGAAAPHLTNVAIHLANSILVFALIRQLTGAFWRSSAVAMLFAVHPLHVESVAWVAERKDVLSSFFGLLTLLFYALYAAGNNLKQIESSAVSHTACRTSLVMAIFFFICGLMSKSMVVTLPFVMLLLDFWPLQRFKTCSLKHLLIEKIPFFALTAADSVITFIFQRKGALVLNLAWVPTTSRVENIFISYARYLVKIFWPFNLAAPYPHPIQWPVPLAAFSIVLFVALCVAAVLLKKKFPFVFTGWFWFAGMLVPVIGLVQVGLPAMADRYAYLPVIGIFIMVVWGAGEICTRLQLPRGGVIFCTILLLAACGVRARNQVGTWRDDQTLFGHALAVTKNNYLASLNLAYWYSKNGQVPNALDCYDKAMQMSTNELAVAWYSKIDRVKSALDYYYNTFRINPNDPTALYNLGNASIKVGRWDEAIGYYRRALQITPNQADILDNLGLALAHNKQLPEAAECFQAALKLQPDSVNAHNNLAAIYFAETNFAAAAREFDAARQLSPNDARICANLAGTYLRLSQTNLAIKYYQQALHLQPDSEQIRGKLQSLGVEPTNK
jgi:Tfp pilus assembly protein PilF